MSKTPEYGVWVNIKQRTSNPNKLEYKHYGARGITMYAEWSASFTAFYEYIRQNLGDKPDKSYTLDRINNDKGYEPGNLRWATQTEQVVNQRLNIRNTSGHKGVGFNTARNKWFAVIGINGSNTWLGCFETKEEAIEARKRGEEKYWGKSND